MEVEVEVLDVTEDEARALLLTIDPLADLAQTQEDLHTRLLEVAPPMPDVVQAAFRAEAEAALAAWEAGHPQPLPPPQFLILVTCGDEREQTQLLQRFSKDGLTCKALTG